MGRGCQIALAGSYISCDEIPVASEDNELSYKHPAYYNRAFFLTPEGESYFYDKRHLFRMGHETEHFTAGSQRAVIRIPGLEHIIACVLRPTLPCVEPECRQRIRPIDLRCQLARLPAESLGHTLAGTRTGKHLLRLWRQPHRYR